MAEVRDGRVADGSGDIATGPALTTTQLLGAIEARHALAREPPTRCDVVGLSEIGIGNTTVAAALLAALTGPRRRLSAAAAPASTRRESNAGPPRWPRL